MLLFIVGGLAAALGAACVVLLVQVRAYSALKRRFSQVIDADAEAVRLVEESKRTAERLRSDMDAALRQREAESARAITDTQVVLARLKAEAAAEAANRSALSAEYANAKLTFDRLSQEVQQLEENLEDISYGLYKPHYSFDTPEEFKREIEKVHEQQKDMTRSGRAAGFAVTWTVAGSQREGAKMQKQYTKLLLRAFNGECDAAVAKVTWNNASKMEERIRKAFDAINELGGVMTVSISPEYRELALAELRLEHELEEKKRAISEEQRRIREQMREEERAQREAEKAQAEAESEESRFEKALERARLDLAKSRGEEHQRLNAKILDLEKQVAEAHAKTVRAKSLAELTKAGYVYVLSNIGSFGDNVFKIGMTRRLEPMDRVKELGDASVPFPFDVHAMVYSEDAPGLENEIHQEFATKSINLVNMRKEFFQVELDEIERFAARRGLKMSFTKLAEAREYRETLEIRRSKTGNVRRTTAGQSPASSLPAAL